MLRRRELLYRPGEFVHEIRLNGDFLMSSVVNDSELALARLGLAQCRTSEPDVLVGGLGLGCTALEALSTPGIRSLEIIELLEPVVEWHRRGILPMGRALLDDVRCKIIQGDFFEQVRSAGRDPDGPRWDAILIDIDHSPEDRLSEKSGSFYADEGLRNLSACLRPGGAFGLWSCDAPDDDFTNRLGIAFHEPKAHPCVFYHPMLDEEIINTIYVAGAPH